MGTIVAVLLTAVVSISLALLFANVFTSSIKSSLSPAASCTTLQIAEPLFFEQANYNAQAQEIELKLKRALASPAITEFSLQFAGTAQGQKKFACSQQCSTCKIPEPGATEIYYIDASAADPPFDLTLIADSCVLATKRISPI